MSGSRKASVIFRQSTLEKDTFKIADRHLRQFPKTHHLFKQAKDFIESISSISIHFNQPQQALFATSLAYQAKLIPKVFNTPQPIAMLMTSFLSGADFANFVRTSFLINQSFSLNKRALDFLSSAISQGFHLQDFLDNFRNQKDQKESVIKFAPQERFSRLVNSLKVQGINNFSVICSRFKKLKKINPIDTLNEDQIILLSGNEAVITEWLKTPRHTTLDLNGGQIIHYLALTGSVVLLKQCHAARMNLEMTDIYGNGIQHYAALSGDRALIEFVKSLKLESKKNYLGLDAKDLMKPIIAPVRSHSNAIKFVMRTIEEKAELLFDTEINISGAQAFDDKYEIMHYAAHGGNSALLFITELLGYNVQRTTIKAEKIDKLAKLSKNPVMMALADVMVRYPGDDKVQAITDNVWNSYFSLTQEGKFIAICLDPKFSGKPAIREIIKTYIKPGMDVLQLYLQLNFCLVNLIVSKKVRPQDRVVNNLRFILLQLVKAMRANVSGVRLLTHDEKTMNPILFHERINRLYERYITSALKKLPVRFQNIQNLNFILKYQERCQYLASVLQYLESDRLLTEDILKILFAMIADNKEGILIAILRVYHEAHDLFTPKTIDWLISHGDHIMVVDDVIRKLASIKKLTQATLKNVCEDIVKYKSLLPSFIKLLEFNLFNDSNKKKLQAHVNDSLALNAIFSLLAPDLLTQDNFAWVMSQVHSVNKLKDIVERLNNVYLLTKEDLHFIWDHQNIDSELFSCLEYLYRWDLLTPVNKQKIYENVTSVSQIFFILSVLDKSQIVIDKNVDLLAAHLQYIDEIFLKVTHLIKDGATLIQDDYVQVFQPYVDKLNQTKSKPLLSWMQPNQRGPLPPFYNVDDKAEVNGLTKPAM